MTLYEHAAWFSLTLVLYTVIDVMFIRFVAGPLFSAHLGDWMRDSIRILPAVLAYLTLTGGLYFFAIQDVDTIQRAAILGAVVGLFGYGIYEFTNLATLDKWSWQMLRLDLAWGISLNMSIATVVVWLKGMI